MHEYVHIASAEIPQSLAQQIKSQMQPEQRVVRLFSLTIPPVFFLATTYVFLGEHVFGLAYVVGKRLKVRLRNVLRAFYLLSTSTVALVLHCTLLYTCGGTASACPPIRLAERNCIAATSTSALFCGFVLLCERWANPMLALGHPTGMCVRMCNAAWLMILWFCVAERQLCSLLLLLFFTQRRALECFPTLDYAYGLLLKGYSLIHMSRILTHECEGVPKYSVATFAVMATL